MKLVKVQVMNFKCVEDSTSFNVGPTTCLVGKNEAGKTALLQALYRLNPVVKEYRCYDALYDYPRSRLSEYEERAAQSPDEVLNTEWELTREEIDSISSEIGEGAMVSPAVLIRAGYDPPGKWKWDFSLDEKAVVTHLLTTGKLDDQDKERYSGETAVAGLIAKLEARTGRSESENAFLKMLTEQFGKNTLQNWLKQRLSAKLPSFVYFSDYYLLPGRVSLDALKGRQAAKSLDDKDRVFLALLELVGTTPEKIHSMKKTEELIAHLEAASNRITNEIFEYWSQNKDLRVQIVVGPGKPDDTSPYNTGTVVQTRILNTRHTVTVNFDERSTGFTWFFSFLVWFSQARKQYGNNLILLLDDPGLGLHARAQADLLRYISARLAVNYQVIYTTHSPFMVDCDRLESVRTVEDAVQMLDTGERRLLGTRVGDNVLSTDCDTVFPLQAALGYEITQSLFVGKNTLLVEGPSDLLYLKWFSQRLADRNRTSLDKSWVIAPCGGIDKVSAFVALFGANKLNTVVLADVHAGDKKKMKSLRESKLLKDGHVLTVDMYVDGCSEADIEDMLGRENYIRLVARCYSIDEPKKVTGAQRVGGSLPVVREVTEYFRTLPPAVPEFDHYSPAEYLTEQGPSFVARLHDAEAAFSRFEKLFRDINALL